MECPSCYSDTPDDSRFCDVCGAALPGCCPSCGAANRVGARFCSKCGQTLTADRSAGSSSERTSSESAQAADRRQLTIMFCDLVGSTALSSQLDPEDMREVIGAYHRCCSDAVINSGGFVAKYMGDGVLAYFGYPQAHEDDVERAIHAAVGLAEAVQQLRTRDDTALQVRIGIATGVVVVGDLIGEGAAQEQGVVGDTPNLAARLQSLAEPGQVVISQSTRRLAGGLFEYRDLGRITVKGLVEPVQAWQVLGPSGVESRFDAHHETGLTPLVGREEELELLMRRWRQAASGEGRVVLLSGEPGIGKSRLTVALQERLQVEPHTRLRFFCSPHHQDSAFYPAIAQLERAAGFERHDTPEAKLDKMTSLLGASSGHENSVQLLADLLSIPTDGRYAPVNWSPQRKKEKTFEALLHQLETLSRERPVLAVYEDVHWIDPSSRELLDMTVECVASFPVLLLITFRSELLPPWVGQAHVTMLSLSRLGRREGAALVERVAGTNALSAVITAEIVERADGVPLFVEELTKAVVEGGGRDEDGRTVSTKPRPAPAVPATLHASLTARLDRLGPAATEIAQIGAAIGREFSYELLKLVARKSDTELQAALRRLNDAGLVSCRGVPPQATFLFKHALVRDVSYATLLRAQRQQLHAHIVSAMEEQFPEIGTAQPDLLALHSTEAGLAEKAVGYRLTAGQRALSQCAMREAVAQLQKGLDLVATLPDGPSRQQQEVDVRTTLVPALIATKGFSAADVSENVAKARALAEHLDRPRSVVSLLTGQIAYHLLRAELKLAQSLAEQIERIGVARNDAAIELLGRYHHGTARFNLGEFAAARALFEQSRGLGEPVHCAVYRGLMAMVPYPGMLAYLARTLTILGYVDQGRLQMGEALSAARELGHPYTQAFVLHFACATEWQLRRPTFEMQRLAKELVAVSSEHGYAFFLGVGLAWRGVCLAALGQAQEGLSVITKGLTELRAMGAVLEVLGTLRLLSETYAVLGQPVEGLKCLADAAHIYETTEARQHLARLHRLRGELLKSVGDDAAAEASLRQSIDIARRQDAKLYELLASTSLARLWRDQGKRTEARDLLAPIYGWFTEGFDTPDLKEARALLDEWAQ
jgi:class 3 adenylate cyclase/tetratricopeptide (TPR) repeat protein